MKHSNNNCAGASFAARTIIRIAMLFAFLLGASDVTAALPQASESRATDMQTIMRVSYPGNPNILEIPVSENVETNGHWWLITVGDYRIELSEHPVITFDRRPSDVDDIGATRDGYAMRDGVISVVSAEDNGSFELYDTGGIRVLALTLPSGRSDIDLSSIEPGIYVARLNNMTFKIQKR